MPGQVSFAPLQTFAAPDYPTNSDVGDIDGDGKPDLVIKNGNQRTFNVYRNTSLPGNLSFAAFTFPTPLLYDARLKVADLDGDSKVDVGMSNNAGNLITIFKNTSNSGNISFVRQDIVSGYNIPWDFDTHDADGDGKPDICFNNDGKITVLRNVVSEPIIFSFSPRKATAGEVISIKGSSFTGSTQVSFSGIPASSFTVLSDTIISATLAGNLAGQVTVTNSFGTGQLTGWFTPPSISSISSLRGKAGDTIIIKGNNFAADVARNTVFFGYQRSDILSATDTSLGVKVPKGIAAARLSVSSNGLTAYSDHSFHIIFNDGHQQFRPNSFEAAKYYDVGNSPGYINIHDLNEDGKPDLMAQHEISAYNDYFQLINKSGQGVLELEGFLDEKMIRTSVLADMNGDGKVERVYSDYTSIDVAKNISVAPADTILFDLTIGGYYETQTSQGPYTYNKIPAVHDLNADGRPDVFTSIAWLNRSGEGVLHFQSLDYKTSILVNQAYASDLDGDGLPDLLAINESSSSGVMVLRNTSVNEQVSFATPVSFVSSPGIYQAVIADIDADAKQDIIVSNRNNSRVALYRNISTPGTVAFAAPQYLATGSSPAGVVVADINGDGKPDIAVANSGENTFSVLKNNSLPGGFAFAAQVKYATGGYPVGINAADLNLDGYTDIAVTNMYANKVAVYINRQAKTTNIILCPSEDDGTITPDITGTSYQWQLSTDSVNYNNLSNDAHYTGVNSQVLMLTSIPSSWYGYRYRCIVDGSNSSIYTLKFENAWTGAVSNAWEDAGNWSCGAVPDINTDVIFTSGTAVVSANTVVRSLTIASGASVTVNAGINLVVTH